MRKARAASPSQRLRRSPRLRPPVRLQSYALTFGFIAVILLLMHGPILDLPFFWDEAGQFIPASLDLFRAGSWIPISTVPNVHPPGVMAYLALCWSIFGYSISGTRIAMLIVASLGALVTFLLAIELARGATGVPAFAALAMLCISPLFFAQAMMAQLDMPAMCLSGLALLLFLQNRIRASAVACIFLVLVKETGLVVPALLGGWLLFERGDRRRRLQSLWFLLPLPGLATWLLLLHHTTGHWFGNADFTAYNLREPLHFFPFVLALLRRCYYLFISTGHIVGTVVLIWAWRRMPLLRDRSWRIAASFVIAQVVMVSALGGAVLERYLLPALPIVYIAFAVSFQALATQTRRFALAGLMLCLVAANFVNPPYPFPFENNLAFVNFVALEETATDRAEQDARALPGGGVVAAAFPVANALRNPDYGFVETPHKVFEVVEFSPAEVEKLKAEGPNIVIWYQRTWDPLHLLDKAPVRDFLARHYGYVPEMSPPQIAEALSMHVARRWTRGGLAMEILER